MSHCNLLQQESCVEMYVKDIVAGAWNDKPCNTPRNVICQGPKSKYCYTS